MYYTRINNLYDNLAFLFSKPKKTCVPPKKKV